MQCWRIFSWVCWIWHLFCHHHHRNDGTTTIAPTDVPTLGPKGMPTETTKVPPSEGSTVAPTNLTTAPVTVAPTSPSAAPNAPTNTTPTTGATTVPPTEGSTVAPTSLTTAPVTVASTSPSAAPTAPTNTTPTTGATTVPPTEGSTVAPTNLTTAPATVASTSPSAAPTTPTNTTPTATTPTTPCDFCSCNTDLSQAIDLGNLSTVADTYRVHYWLNNGKLFRDATMSNTALSGDLQCPELTLIPGAYPYQMFFLYVNNTVKSSFYSSIVDTSNYTQLLTKLTNSADKTEDISLRQVILAADSKKWIIMNACMNNHPPDETWIMVAQKENFTTYQSDIELALDGLGMILSDFTQTNRAICDSRSAG